MPPKKDCPAGKIRNPKTGRCIDAHGKLAQELGLAKKATPKAKAASPKGGSKVKLLRGKVLTGDLADQIAHVGAHMTIKFQSKSDSAVAKIKYPVKVISRSRSNGTLALELTKSNKTLKSMGINAGSVFNCIYVNGAFVFAGPGAIR